MPAANSTSEARKALTAGMETLPAELRPALQRELVRIALREGQWDQAREQMLKLHKTDPTNVELLTQLAELAFETGKFQEVEQWEKELRKLEGPDGLSCQYYEARRLLAQANGPEDANLTRASELQTHIQNRRPAWPKAYLLSGLLRENRGKFEQAVEAYQEAIRLGEQQSMAYERLISLLTQLDRLAEADRYLQLLQDQIASPESAVLLGDRRGRQAWAIRSCAGGCPPRRGAASARCNRSPLARPGVAGQREDGGGRDRTEEGG